MGNNVALARTQKSRAAAVAHSGKSHKQRPMGEGVAEECRQQFIGGGEIAIQRLEGVWNIDAQ